MSRKPYGMICPITRVCEILEPRWTIAVLVALWAGASKFNEIRREIGSISPTLLAKRLKDLEALGLVERIEDRARGQVDYIRTPAAIALEPALEALAQWSQCHVQAEAACCKTSVSNLMWNARKHIRGDELPNRRVVIQFRFSDPGLEYDTYWALHHPDAPLEICTSIPGYEVDLFIETNALSLSAVFLGRTSIDKERELDEMFVSGDALLARTIGRWLVPMRKYGRYEGIKQLRDDDDRPATNSAALREA